MAVAVTSPHAAYVVRHADDCLILAQRLSEWSAHAPELEEDIALTNLALDLLGQARALYGHAAVLEGAGFGEDDLAFWRDERQFTNLLLVEQPNGDFADTMARQLFFSAYQLSLWPALEPSADTTLGGIAAKAHKEARYHLRHASTWVVRLGDGTEESHRRMQAAVNRLWRFTGEMFSSDELDAAMTDAGVGADPAAFAAPWAERIGAVLDEATLARPEDPFQRTGGRTGHHTEHLGHLLAEMQILQRSHPGAQW